MRSLSHRAAAWAMAGGTFLAVVALPGCAAFNSSKADVGSSASADESSIGKDSPAAVDYKSRAPVVNIFGELNGVAPESTGAVGRANFQQQTFCDEGYDADVSVDASGKWMVYASTRNAEKTDIYLQKTDGTAVVQLTSDAGEDDFPVFSPDGKTIAFCSTRSGAWKIYTMDADGRQVVQVTGGPSQDVHPSFSPDGTRLVYSSMSPRGGEWELWTVNLKSGQRRMIGYGLFPSWSPDRMMDRIAFQRPRQRGSRWFGLWTLKLVDGEATRLTELAVSSNAAIITPCWSPDGKKLAFAAVVEPDRSVDGKSSWQQDIWVIDADGSNRRRLSDGIGANLTPFWAVDNRVYFISNRSGTECVWSVRGGDEQTYTAIKADEKTGRPTESAKTNVPAPAAVGAVDPRPAAP